MLIPGLEWDNPDISPNYFAAASYDLNNYDRDPMPSFTDSKFEDTCSSA